MVDGTTGGAGFRVPASLGAAFALVIQIVVAVILFLAIGAAAVALNVATDFCETQKLAPPWIVFGMRALEVLLWMVDVVCCVTLILREAYDFCLTIAKKEKGSGHG